MPPLMQFFIRRLLAIPVSFIVIAIVLYTGVMLTPPEMRAELSMPPLLSSHITEDAIERYRDTLIDRYHLRDPYPVKNAI